MSEWDAKYGTAVVRLGRTAIKRVWLGVGLVVLVMLCAVCDMRAQFPLIRNFDSRDYDGGTQNWCVAETEGGYVLVANNLGLLLFNGKSWEKHAMPNHTALHAVVASYDEERFYVGAFEEFGYFRNEPPLRCARYVSLASALDDDMRRGLDIWSIVRLPDSRVVYRGNHMIYVYNPKTNTISPYRFASRITDVGVAGNHAYVSTESAIYILRHNLMTRITGSEDAASHRIAGVYTDGDNAVFVGRDGWLFRYSGHHIEPYIKPVLSDALDGVNVYSVADNDTWVAIGTVGHGLLAYDRRGGILHRLDISNGLGNNTVLNVMIDHSDNIWAALDNGLSYVIFDSPFRTLFSDLRSIGTGYASMPWQSRLYLGTNQGLYSIEQPGDYSHHTFTPMAVDGVKGQIWSLGVYGDQLLCGADAGTYAVSGNRATPISDAGPAWGFSPYPGRDDILVAALYDGFGVLERRGDSWKFRNRIADSTESTCNFVVDADGSIWYSHWLQGVYHLRLTDDLRAVESAEYYNASNQLPTDANNLVTIINGQVYISAADGFYMRGGGGELQRVGWLDRLFPSDGVTTRLLQTPDGDIWAYRPDFLAIAKLSTDGGRRHYSVRRFHYEAIVSRLQMNIGNMSYLPGGMTVMNQDNGFYVVADIADTSAVTGVYISSVSYDPRHPERPEQLVYRPAQDKGHFEVVNSSEILYFEYSLPQYRDVDAVVFSTKIDGYDKEWTPYGPEGYRYISHIGPGSYTFRVRARDTISGIESEASVTFKVRARWFESWWFITICLIIGLVIAYLGIDWVRNRVSAIIERRRMHEEQTRIEHEKNEQLSREIKQKSSELAGSDISQQRTAAIMREVDDALTEILRAGDSESLPSIVSRVRSVRQAIRMHSLGEENWDRVEENFNIVFDDLLQKLASNYPSLTRNDIRLCAYLKLDMTTKEIASLMNLSERSVESHRYRLRKKLGMTPGMTFTDFFRRAFND